MEGGGNEYEKGEIGLKTAWGEMLTMRQRWEEGGGQREESRGRFSAKKTAGWEEVITMSWMPPCPQIPNREGEATPVSSPSPPLQLTKHCTTCSILLRTRQIPLTVSLLRCKEKDSSGGTTASQKKEKTIPNNTNLNWRPLWAGENPLQEEL